MGGVPFQLLCGAAFVSATAFACTPSGKPSAPVAELTVHASEQLPADVPHRTFVDFGGKLHLLGFAVSPENAAGPGSPVHLKLYWQRVGELGEGWGLFTHLENEGGRQLANLDREGALRKAIAGKPEGVAQLELGNVYEDEQSFQMPSAGDLSPTTTLVVGVWKESTRLPIVSGTSNGHDAAIVTHFSTGVARRTRAQSSQARK
jgi:hypothetical protein